MGRTHRWKASAFLPVLRSKWPQDQLGPVIISPDEPMSRHGITAEGGRLNSFCAAGHHQDVVSLSFTATCLSFCHSRLISEIKNPAYVAVSRAKKINSILQNLLTPSLSKLPSSRCPIGAEDRSRRNTQPGLYRL